MYAILKRSKVTTQPAQEPVTLAELKAQLRITDASQDAYLTGLLTYAREIVEQYLGRKLIEQTLTMFMDAWPMGQERWFSGIQQGARVSLQCSNDIELPWLPLASVTSVSSFDDSNTENAFDSANYYVDDSSEDIWGRVILNTGSSWPSDLRLQNAIKIVYKVGYGTDPEDVPGAIRQGILMVATWMYSYRGDCAGGKCMVACGAFGVLKPYRVIII